jgi:hypothetical protein
LFPTETEADANNTTNAIRLADDINSLNVSIINDLSQAYDFATWQLMVDSAIAFPDGKPLRTLEHTAGTGIGGADYVKTAGSTTKPIGSPDLTGGGHATLQSTNGYFYPKQFGAISGQDSFAAIQACIVESGEGAVIFYGDADDEFLVVGGELPLVSNQRHIYNGAKLTRTVLDNTNAMYLYTGAIGSLTNVVFAGGFIEAFTNNSVGGESATAACIHITGGDNIFLYGMDLQKGASGLQVYSCNNVKVYDSNITENSLTGISGVANGFKVKRSTVKSNGFLSGGFTHEVYMINTANAEIIDCSIGANKDFSTSLNVKNKTVSVIAGFANCDNWKVKGSTFFDDGGISFTNAASEGEAAADQIPHRNNSFSITLTQAQQAYKLEALKTVTLTAK